MTTRRVLAALLVAAPVLAAPVASAAPRTYCHLLRDPIGDTSPQEDVADGYGSEVDIVSADVATDARVLTAVVRLRDLASADPAHALYGRTYEFFFTIGVERSYSLHAQFGNPTVATLFWHSEPWTNPEDERAGLLVAGARTERLAGATARVVAARNEVRITVPLTAFGLHRDGIKRGTRLYDFAALTDRSVGDFPGSPLPSEAGGARWYVHPGVPWDVANGTRSAHYVVGARSCVRPGA